MRFTIDGEAIDLDVDAVAARLRGLAPEQVQTHWVDVEGTRFPVKQALEAGSGISRNRFTSQTARSVLIRLGFVTSSSPTLPAGTSRPSPRTQPTPRISAEEAGAAFATLVTFLRGSPLTDGVSTLEHQLVEADRHTVAAVTNQAGLTDDLLRSALIVRRDVGRISDVIHAAVIALALPVILDEGETVTNRPSLGPGNDKSRPYDLETNRRVAEFKVAVWSGGDMMRKRTLTADLVHLALDGSGRRPELWVAGEQPLRFLRTSTTSVADLLSRSSKHLRARFQNHYGPDPIPLHTFTAEHAARVRLCNLAEVLPAVASALL
ncbi:PE-PGRS family protein [Actinoplanes aureus]|uniref:PE-PGRS family protein n=1 Tax=Actinoplanes aureus TaxID=2792083 RepID=A0A931FX83_9ACTN|nr:PE-PGRS family protein [Actinoplanes aureus]MBG0562497.1 PE-PGRS family protein [Actinoplanes aureus]